MEWKKNWKSNFLSFDDIVEIFRENISWRIHKNYSIVKDSNADLGVIFLIVQNPPKTKAVLY